MKGRRYPLGIQTFKNIIEELAQANDMSYEEALAELRYNYDGYHFSGRGADMYNPYSMFNCLETHEFDSYWFSTGTPTFLIELLQEKNIDMLQLDDIWTTSDRFDTPTASSAIMRQTEWATVMLLYGMGKELHLERRG